MFRTTDIVLICVMVSAAAFTYKTKHDAEERLRTVRRLQQQITYEQDTIDILKADWSLLTQPARLQKLSEVYGSELQLQPVNPRQIVGLADIPAKPPLEIHDIIAGEAGKPGPAGTDKIKTGAVKR